MFKQLLIISSIVLGCHNESPYSTRDTNIGNHADFNHVAHLEAWYWRHGESLSFCIAGSEVTDELKGKVSLIVKDAFLSYQKYVTNRVQKLPSQLQAYFAMQLTFKPMCDGKTDLRIFFITSEQAYLHVDAPEDTQWESTLTGYYNKTIWFSPTLLDADLRLLAILVRHQLGHTFGIPHIPGTIMDQSLSQNIKNLIKVGKDESLEQKINKLEEIDQERALLLPFVFDDQLNRSTDAPILATGCYGQLPAKIKIFKTGEYLITSLDEDQSILRISEWLEKPEAIQDDTKEIFIRNDAHFAFFNIKRTWRGTRISSSEKEILRINSGNQTSSYVHLEHSPTSRDQADSIFVSRLQQDDCTH